MFIEYWLSHDLNWNLEVLELAAELKSAGHALYIATNQDKIRGDFIKSQAKVGQLFKGVFTSAKLGVCKPSPGFYQRIRAEYFLNSTEDILVIDDDPRNIEAAKQLQWQGVCFDPDRGAYIQLLNHIQFVKLCAGILSPARMGKK